MKLVDLLGVDRILLGVPGTTVRDIARPLVDAAIASGRVRDPEKLDALLAESLPREAVTVGQRAFLLHFRSDVVQAMTAALGVAAEPVHREHDPAKEARVVLLLLAPSHDASAFLRGLAAFGRALAHDDLIDALLAAEHPADVLAIPALAGIDMPADLLVRDVLGAGVISARPETTLAEAAAMMTLYDVPALPVVSDEKEVLGIISYGDLLRYFLPAHTKRLSGETPGVGRGSKAAMAGDPREMTLREAMDRSVLCVSEDQALSEVAALMVNKNIDRVPVVREGALVGLLTREDIVRRLL
ncbi:MAG TPA: CBS domain-containing protein [Gemmatimonadales bacterium]|nr:CBS domain-containing protein [Gemmatimonadales bacterium]